MLLLSQESCFWIGRALDMEWVSRVIFLEAPICVGDNLSVYVGRGYPRQCIQAGCVYIIFSYNNEGTIGYRNSNTNIRKKKV